MIQNIKEIFSANKKYKAVIYKNRGIYEIKLFQFYPEIIDNEGDIWEEFWQEVTTTKTITDTELNAVKLATKELDLLK